MYTFWIHVPYGWEKATIAAKNKKQAVKTVANLFYVNEEDVYEL